MNKPSLQIAVGKILTGIQGFDEITGGGLPRGRTTLVMGGAGSGKTVFALETLVNGAHQQKRLGCSSHSRRAHGKLLPTHPHSGGIFLRSKRSGCSFSTRGCPPTRSALETSTSRACSIPSRQKPFSANALARRVRGILDGQ